MNNMKNDELLALSIIGFTCAIFAVVVLFDIGAIDVWSTIYLLIGLHIGLALSCIIPMLVLPSKRK